MALAIKYTPEAVEKKWYKFWLDNEIFKSIPNEKTPYTIVIPPPNVTGVLHMGHMLNNTLQDVLIRRARMQGKNACWVPGTDHASIATEAKVSQKLKEEGISKKSLTREAFLEHAWDWTHKHGGIILEQLKRLGASCDWSREAFTMDEIRSESVIQTFCDLYNDGFIYRGFRMVNWDPEAQTTLSDEEVIHKDVNAKLYYVQYPIVNTNQKLTIATTRPETILGDTAICVHPKDVRYAQFIGQEVLVPIANRKIPIIADEYVDMEFGTGCLKITPAHDINDKNIGDKHKLEVIDVLNPDGTLNENGLHYKGQDRFKVRKSIAKELDEKGFLSKIEDYKTSVGTSERTGAVIEPRLSVQWFLAMEKLSKPALDAVMNDDVRLIPEKFKNTYRHWMENVRDWNISRQLYWGHRIPVWYFGDGFDDFVVAKNEEEAVKKATEKLGKKLTSNNLKQEEDVLDTWFSSWLWPLSVFDGIRHPTNEEALYYYPTQTLVTAPEILFFWVARMIILGYYYKNEKPFYNVYLTGIVRDKQGRKMSKSLGNSPDPIELIEKYGADGVRVGMLLTSPAGNDLPFDEALCLQGRNFINKIWNAYRLIDMWKVDSKTAQKDYELLAIEWFENRFAQVEVQLQQQFEQFRISEALMSVYKLIWNDFCSSYLEIIKPSYGDGINADTLSKTKAFFDGILRLLHPFAPFVTEELWQNITEANGLKSICLAEWPNSKDFNQKIIDEVNHGLELVAAIRNYRNKEGISPKVALEISILPGKGFSNNLRSLIRKLANISNLTMVEKAPENCLSILVNKTQCFIPIDNQSNAEEKITEIKKEIDYLKGFLNIVNKKLSNDRFINNAPEAVVQVERQKQKDALEKIEKLQQQLELLS